MKTDFKKHQVFLMLLLLAGGVVFAPSFSFAIDSMPDYIKTLKAKIEVLTDVPDKLQRNTEYPVTVRVTNTGSVPLPGIPLVDLAKGEPVLSLGWGFSKHPEEDFVFLGTYPADRPIQPGETRDFDIKFTVDRPDMKYFRIGLWVSRKEEAGYMGGPIGNKFTQKSQIPTTFRDASRKALVFALVICNLFFLGFLLVDFILRRKSRHSTDRISS